jgi:hypothetical protein
MSVVPATYLVTKDAKSTCPVRPHRTFGDDAALIAADVADRRHLDYDSCRRDANFQRRVVQVARRSPLGPRQRGLEHATIESDEVSTSP